MTWHRGGILAKADDLDRRVSGLLLAGPGGLRRIGTVTDGFGRPDAPDRTYGRWRTALNLWAVHRDAMANALSVYAALVGNLEVATAALVQTAANYGDADRRSEDRAALLVRTFGWSRYGRHSIREWQRTTNGDRWEPSAGGAAEHTIPDQPRPEFTKFVPSPPRRGILTSASGPLAADPAGSYAPAEPAWLLRTLRRAEAWNVVLQISIEWRAAADALGSFCSELQRDAADLNESWRGPAATAAQSVLRSIGGTIRRLEEAAYALHAGTREAAAALEEVVAPGRRVLLPGHGARAEAAAFDRLNARYLEILRPGGSRLAYDLAYDLPFGGRLPDARVARAVYGDDESSPPPHRPRPESSPPPIEQHALAPPVIGGSPPVTSGPDPYANPLFDHRGTPGLIGDDPAPR